MSVTSKVSTVEQQRELFLWKFRDISRADVNELLKDFRKHDLGNKGELDEHEAMMFLEHRGSAKTATELRGMVGEMDKDHNHRLSFLEWCCAYYQKSYAELNNFVDEAARERALEEAMKAGEEAKAAELEIERANAQKELQASLRAAALERESKLTGVAGMKAFFFRKVEGASDVTKTNEQTIKEEAARRKALREAKMKQNEAIQNADKVRSAEEVAKEMELQAQRTADAEAAALRKRDEDEKAARAARKAALNAKWGGTGLNSTIAEKGRRASLKINPVNND